MITNPLGNPIIDTVSVSIDEIKPYPKNAKVHDHKQIEKIANSIKEFGFNQPLVLDQDKVIIVGHGRFEAAKLLNYTEVPCLIVDLTEDQAKAYRLADNKLNESPWEVNLAIEELKSLDGHLFELTGFAKDFITGIQEDDFDAQKEYDSINIPTTKFGQMFQLGRHRLICGDSTKQEFFLRLKGSSDKLARLIFTDPPYNVNYKSPGGLDYSSKKFGGTGGKIFNDNKSDEDCLKFYTDTLKNLYKYSADEATIYWWFANKNNWINREAFDQADWHMSQIIVWVKNSMVFSRGQDYHRMYEPCMAGWKKKRVHFKNKKLNNLKDVFNLDYNDFSEIFDVWYQKRDVTSKYVHPTQKPVRLAERALKKNSEEGDIVIDCFGGSGSTLIACEQMNRDCWTMEMDPKYCDVIIRRWEQFTNQKAELIT